MGKWSMALVLLFLSIFLVSHASPVAEADPDPMNVNIQVIQRIDSGCDVEPEKTHTPKKRVKAAFKVTNAEYNENLRDHNSTEYKTLKKEITHSVRSALRKKHPGKIVDFDVDFFNKGSVVVHSTVTTTEENQKAAYNIVADALCNSGVVWLNCSSVSVGVRLCVPGQDSRVVEESCAAMKQDNSDLDIICVNARDRYDCLSRLATGEVDIFHGDAADVYLAQELPGDDLSVVATTRSEDKLNDLYQYLPVAVVRRSAITGLSDLKGSKSCHTGYGKTSGWHVPLTKLLEEGELTPNCSSSASVTEIDISSVSSYFGPSCIPGTWAPDTDINTKLKSDYSKLCQLCGNPSQCDSGDVYAGYQGALKCLIDAEGHVAWTKYEALDEFFQTRPQVNKADFGLLCPDGSINNLDTVTDCNWGAKPWNAWLTRADEGNKKSIVSVLTDAMETAVEGNSEPKDWGKVLLGISKNSAIKYIHSHVSPDTYLDQAGGYGTTISRKSCPGNANAVSICVNSAIEEKKCQELAAVLRSRRVQPEITCVSPSEGDDCVAAVTKGDAHIVSLDGGDFFKGHTTSQIIPVISEVYGHHDANYFAVAVVRANSGISSLAQLQGKKSCHTGIQKTAGWKIPTVSLLEDGLINKTACDYVGQVGSFFSESCAPGAKLPKYDPNGSNPDSLCNLCVGDKDPEATDPLASKCSRDSSEAYYSYTGAFRCLVEGGGDVAFIKHTTVIGDTNGNSNHTWNQNLQSSEFRLVCKDGTTANVSDYESCHLAKVPSHKVVTAFNTDNARKEQIKLLLLRAGETLPHGQDVFAMFGDYGSYHDIMFKSSATKLINLSDDDVTQLLNGTYYKALTELDKC